MNHRVNRTIAKRLVVLYFTLHFCFHIKLSYIKDLSSFMQGIFYENWYKIEILFFLVYMHDLYIQWLVATLLTYLNIILAFKRELI